MIMIICSVKYGGMLGVVRGLLASTEADTLSR